MSKLSLIFATTPKGAIGKNNDLPWAGDPDTKWDMDHFRKTTTGHPVIMGFKTMKSFPKPLPNRYNIVISLEACDDEYCINLETGRDDIYYKTNISKEDRKFYIVNSLEEAIRVSKLLDDVAYIIGGAYTYIESMKKGYADECIITYFNKEYDADIYFPMDVLFDNYDVEKEELHELGKIVTYSKRALE